MSYDETCPEKGLQSIESMYPEDRLLDMGGYCAWWSMFLLELRLQNYKYDPREIQRMLIEANPEPKVLRDFIRNYVYYLYKQ